MLNSLSPLFAEKTFALLVWRKLASTHPTPPQKIKDKGVCTGKVPAESHFLEQKKKKITEICIEVFFFGLLGN